MELMIGFALGGVHMHINSLDSLNYAFKLLDVMDIIEHQERGHPLGSIDYSTSYSSVLI